MSETKYKKGDIIMRYDGVLLRIGWFESAKGLYHGHVGDSIHQGWASDADIKCAVKIIPEPVGNPDKLNNRENLGSSEVKE